MQKYIQIKFGNGERYIVPASVIAKSRADYYAINVDGYEENSSEWKSEYDYSLGDDGELMDWIQNNMDWVDLKEHAIKQDAKSDYDYDKEFFGAEIQIIKK